jgi:hypothetical protein
MRREFDPSAPERMDVAETPSAELLEDLRNLEWLNRQFGSHRLLLHFLRKWWLPGVAWQVVDWATGYGDLPRQMVRFGRRQNSPLQVVAVDANPATLELAKAASVGYRELDFVRGDLRSFRVPPETDLLSCHLALHHFSEEDAVEVLRRAWQSGARRLLFTDLRRGRDLQWGVWLLTALILRAPMTRHDARVSVKRAFSGPELCALARQAGWENFHWGRFSGFRQAIWWEAE